MTETFEEYLKSMGLSNVECKDCKKLIGYEECNDGCSFCPNCMKKDYEKNKR